MPILKKGNVTSYASTDFGAVDFKKDDTISDFVQARWASREQHRQSLERQWYLNIANYLGQQYLQWNPVTKSLFLPRQPRHRVRATVNRLMPMVRRIIASTVRQRPQWTVSPATGELNDRITAGLATDYLRYYWTTHGMNDKLIDLLTWRSTTGNVFVRVFWDAFKGDKIAAEPEDFSGEKARSKEEKKKAKKAGEDYLRTMGLAGPEDAKASKKIGVAIGDVDVEICSPFEIDPDPDATRWEDVSHLIHTKARSISYVKDRYGLKDDEVQGDDNETVSRFFERQLSSLTGPSNFGSVSAWGTAGQQGSGGTVLVHQLWCRPTPDYPSGYWAAVIGDRVVRKGENPPGFPVFPYAHIREVAVPGRLWGSCVLEQCLPIQAAYNRARSQIIEHLNAVSRPQWLIPKGSGISKTSFTGEPGEKIFYTYPLKPELSRPGELPSVTHQNINQTLGDFEDVSSPHEAYKGATPGRVESGLGIAQLQEQDDGILAPASMSTSDALRDIGTWTLQISAKKITEDRMIKLFGSDRTFDVRYFKGEDLLGGSSRTGTNYFDVMVELGSSLPSSKGARQQLGISLAQFGILNPGKKEDREKLLEILEVGADPTDVSPGQMDKQNARRENMEMITQQGQYLPPSWPFDDDALHISVHREFQKTPEYWQIIQETGGAESPIHMIFEMHIQAHAERLSAQYNVPQEGEGGPAGPEGPMGPAGPEEMGGPAPEGPIEEGGAPLEGEPPVGY